MEILGNIIKKAIELKDKLTFEEDPYKAQEKVLEQLLDKAKDTAFGKYYDFAGILKSDDIQAAYARKVPTFDYQKIYDEWWHKIIEGQKDVTWPGDVTYLALSSGTTGDEPKRIPVTDDMLESIKKAGVLQVTSLANFDLPPSFFEKEIMMLGSSTDLKENKKFREGEISGISASNIPFWFRGYYKPGEDIANIEDWDERVNTIAKKAKEWDIGALSGIPSWIELMLKRVIEYNNLNTIHDIWPNLHVYATGGVAFEPYRKSFEKLLAHPLYYVDTYLASEGFLALQTRPETDAMALVLDNGIYFEFVPFEEQNMTEDGGVAPDAPVYTIEQAEEGKEYILLITTVAGAWRYMIGDTIKITDKELNEIIITGRTKHFLNVVGSQLSVHKMNDAMKTLEEEEQVTIREFTVAAVRRESDDEFIHRWYLGVEEDTRDETALAQKLDDTLKDRNKNYAVARTKALKGVEVRVVSPDVFYEWNAEQKNKGGQVKMPRVMKGEQFAEWEAFIDKNYAAQ